MFVGALENSRVHTQTHTFECTPHAKNVCALQCALQNVCEHSSNCRTRIVASPLLLPAPVCLCTCVCEREERETHRERERESVCACALVIVGLG